MLTAIDDGVVIGEGAGEGEGYDRSESRGDPAQGLPPLAPRGPTGANRGWSGGGGHDGQRQPAPRARRMLPTTNATRLITRPMMALVWLRESFSEMSPTIARTFPAAAAKSVK